MKKSRQLNVLQVGGHFDQFRGGGNLRNGALFKSLAKECNLFVVAYIEDGNHIEMNLRTENSFKSFKYQNNFFLQIVLVLKLIIFENIDIIHTHNIRLATFLSFMLPWKKVILEFHGISDYKGFRGKIFLLMMKQVSGFIVLSKSLKDFLVSKYNIHPGKVEYIINGFDLDVKNNIQLKNLSPEIIKIGYIGTLHEWQGVLNFSNVIKSILNSNKIEKNVIFSFIGNGNSEIYNLLEKDLKPYIENSKVLLVGQVSPIDIPRHWKEQDIIVMPRPSTFSTETIIPLKLIDALNYGKLIVASNVGGLTEILVDKSNGLLYDKYSLADFEEKLLFSIHNYSNLFEIRQNAVFTSNNLPTWDNQAQKVLDFYMSIK